MYSVLLLVFRREVPTELVPDLPIFEPQVLQLLLCSTDVFPDADLSQRLTSFLFWRDRLGGSSQTTAGHSSIRAISPTH